MNSSEGDLRKLEVACKACEGCTQVYNLAADMGGMGFIVSNESVLAFNNTAISMNMLEAARRNKVKDVSFIPPVPVSTTKPSRKILPIQV